MTRGSYNHFRHQQTSSTTLLSPLLRKFISFANIMDTNIVCWNCWATDHDRLTCRNPTLSITDREQLRLRVGAPIPDDPQYNAMLQTPCFNCWESTEHYHLECQKPRKANEEREKLRVEMGIPLSPLWVRFLRLKSPHIRPMKDDEKPQAAVAMQGSAGNTYQGTTARMGPPGMNNGFIGNSPSRGYGRGRTNDNGFLGPHVQRQPRHVGRPPIRSHAPSFVSHGWTPTGRQTTFKQPNRGYIAISPGGAIQLNNEFPPLVPMGSNKHAFAGSPSSAAGSKDFASRNIHADQATISKVYDEVVEMRTEFSAFSADTKRSLKDISDSISDLKEAISSLFLKKKATQAAIVCGPENEGKQPPEEDAKADNAKDELTDTKEESLESIERRYLPKSLDEL